MRRPVYVDTMSGLCLIKEWHEKHLNLCLGMSVEMEGFFKEHIGRGLGTSEAALTRYRSKRNVPSSGLRVEGAGFEVTQSAYKWRGARRNNANITVHRWEGKKM